MTPATPSAFEAWFNQGYPKQPRGTYYRKAMREAWEAALTLAAGQVRQHCQCLDKQGIEFISGSCMACTLQEAIEGLKG